MERHRLEGLGVQQIDLRIREIAPSFTSRHRCSDLPSGRRVLEVMAGVGPG